MRYSRWSAWWLLIWWRVTQFVSSFRAIPLPTSVRNLTYISKMLGEGSLYRPDRPLAGMWNPGYVWARATNDQRVGDCEDHAGFWVAMLIRAAFDSEGRMLESIAIGTVWGLDANGKHVGHAVALFGFRDHHGVLTEYWADYGLPQPAVIKSWDWAKEIARRYGWTYQAAYILEVRGVSRRGSLQFGKITAHEA